MDIQRGIFPRILILEIINNGLQRLFREEAMVDRMFLTLIDQSTNLPGDMSPLTDVEKFHLKNQRNPHHTSEVRVSSYFLK